MKNPRNLRCAAAALLVLAVFAVGVLGTLLGGAGIYRRLTQRDRTAFHSRTGLQFIATRVRQAAGPVEIAPYGDADALLIRQEMDGEAYLTRIYCHDGWLMELFTGETGDFDPRDGEKILPAQGLTLELENDLLRAVFTDSSGADRELYLHLRQGEVAP